MIVTAFSYSKCTNPLHWTKILKNDIVNITGKGESRTLPHFNCANVPTFLKTNLKKITSLKYYH